MSEEQVAHPSFPDGAWASDKIRRVHRALKRAAIVPRHVMNTENTLSGIVIFREPKLVELTRSDVTK